MANSKFEVANSKFGSKIAICYVGKPNKNMAIFLATAIFLAVAILAGNVMLAILSNVFDIIAMFGAFLL